MNYCVLGLRFFPVLFILLPGSVCVGIWNYDNFPLQVFNIIWVIVIKLCIIVNMDAHTHTHTCRALASDSLRYYSIYLLTGSADLCWDRVD